MACETLQVCRSVCEVVLKYMLEKARKSKLKFMKVDRILYIEFCIGVYILLHALELVMSFTRLVHESMSNILRFVRAMFLTKMFLHENVFYFVHVHQET